jgi:hypothetical protein
MMEGERREGRRENSTTKYRFSYFAQVWEHLRERVHFTLKSYPEGS